jgi:SAM-dependent methyltransferase
MSSAHLCPVCDDTHRESIFRTRDRHFKIPGEWTVARCTGCGLVQIDPMLTTQQLMALYPTDFYAFQDLAKKQKGLVATLKRLLFPTVYTNDPPLPRPGRILDSGCGTGWALLKFKELGWDCIGVEPGANAAKFGREHYDLDVRAGTVLTEKFPTAHFDYIRANHSLEHDPDAGDTIAEFRRILRGDGKLLIGVPNFDSLPARWFGRYWWYLGAPVHTYNFSVRHLSRLLNRYGFEVESIRYAGNFAGLVGSLQIYLNRNRPELASTDGWFVNSAISRIVGQAVAVLINLFRRGDAIEIVAHPLQRAHASGDAR